MKKSFLCLFLLSGSVFCAENLSPEMNREGRDDSSPQAGVPFSNCSLADVSEALNIQFHDIKKEMDKLLSFVTEHTAVFDAEIAEQFNVLCDINVKKHNATLQYYEDMQFFFMNGQDGEIGKLDGLYEKDCSKLDEKILKLEPVWNANSPCDTTEILSASYEALKIVHAMQLDISTFCLSPKKVVPSVFTEKEKSFNQGKEFVYESVRKLLGSTNQGSVCSALLLPSSGERKACGKNSAAYEVEQKDAFEKDWEEMLKK